MKIKHSMDMLGGWQSDTIDTRDAVDEDGNLTGGNIILEYETPDGKEMSIEMDHCYVKTSNDLYHLSQSLNGKLLISGPYGQINVHSVDENTVEVSDPVPEGPWTPAQQALVDYWAAENANPGGTGGGGLNKNVVTYWKTLAGLSVAPAAVAGLAPVIGLAALAAAAPVVVGAAANALAPPNTEPFKGGGVAAGASARADQTAKAKASAATAAAKAKASAATAAAKAKAASSDPRLVAQVAKALGTTSAAVLAIAAGLNIKVTQSTLSQIDAVHRAQQSGGGAGNPDRYIGGSVGAIEGGGWRL
jgi:hypothetical protein